MPTKSIPHNTCHGFRFALNEEFRYRYEKDSDHRSIEVLREISRFRYENRGLTAFAQAMPDRYKVPGDAVGAYRQYYIGEKMTFAAWTKRDVPEWIPADALKKPTGEPSSVPTLKKRRNRAA